MSVGIAEIIEFYDNMLPVMEQYHSSPNSRIEKTKSTLSNITHPGMSVLDVGCGTGILSKHLADIGASVTSIDISTKLVEYARINSAHKNIVYMDGDICGYTSKKKYDIVVFSDVIEHIKPEELKSMLLRLSISNTHDKSVMYMNIPNKNFLKFMYENYPQKLQIVDEAYSIGYITSLLSLCGFSPANIEIYGIDSNFQYNEYIFLKNEAFTVRYKEQLDSLM